MLRLGVVSTLSSKRTWRIAILDVFIDGLRDRGDPPLPSSGLTQGTLHAMQQRRRQARTPRISTTADRPARKPGLSIRDHRLVPSTLVPRRVPVDRFYVRYGTVSLGREPPPTCRHPTTTGSSSRSATSPSTSSRSTCAAVTPCPVRGSADTPIMTGLADSGPDGFMTGGSLAEWFDVVIHAKPSRRPHRCDLPATPKIGERATHFLTA